MPEDLTPDLDALERALAARPAPALPASLRGRVLGAVRSARADSFAGAWSAHRRWIAAGAAAAAMLLWLNIARLAPGTGGLGGVVATAPGGTEQVRALRAALPELDDRDLDRLGLLQAACSRGRSVPPACAVR